MASRTSEAGKVDRLVKIDYSLTYRDNDKLDLDLDDHLIHLTRTAQRSLSEKEEELESARADADKILKLKAAVNQRQEGEPTLAILCHSVTSPWRRKSSDAFSRRKVSSASGRRISAVSSARESLQEGEGGEGGTTTTPSGSQELPDMAKLSLTQRRLVRQREQFSAKNLFNVRRAPASSSSHFLQDSKRRDVSPDLSRATTPTSTLQPSSSKRKSRPRTSPAAYRSRRSPQKSSQSYMRPTTASARLVSFAVDGEDDGFPVAPRRPRSRRELQRLVELKIDPFEEELEKAERSWGSSSWDRHQSLLHRLQMGQRELQDRVTSFLKTVEDFNKRGSKSTLQHILEAS